MSTKDPTRAALPAQARFITDRELAPMLGVSVAFLQRDRRERKSIPFVRIGDRCMYDAEAVIATIKAATVGGPNRRRASQRDEATS